MDVNFSYPLVQFEKSNIILHRKWVLLKTLRDIFKYALIHTDKSESPNNNITKSQRMLVILMYLKYLPLFCSTSRMSHSVTFLKYFSSPLLIVRRYAAGKGYKRATASYKTIKLKRG